MSPHTKHAHDASPSCGCASACAAETLTAPAAAPAAAPAPDGVCVFRIPSMDCAAEEGEIRHALAKMAGLRSLSFQLGARTLAIDAPAELMPQALAAIRKAGFKPVPLAQSPAGDAHAHGPCGHDHEHSHKHAHGHAHGHGGLARPEGLPRYALALLLALGAEAIAFFAPDAALFRMAGMALAAAAIALAGFSTYVKGLAALRNLRLNMGFRE